MDKLVDIPTYEPPSDLPEEIKNFIKSNKGVEQHTPFQFSFWTLLKRYHNAFQKSRFSIRVTLLHSVKTMNSDVRRSSCYIKKYNNPFTYILISHSEPWNDYKRTF